MLIEIRISLNIANNLYNLLFRCVSFMMRVIYKQIKYVLRIIHVPSTGEGFSFLPGNIMYYKRIINIQKSMV